MKSIVEDVFFEKWVTPVLEVNHLTLEALYQSTSQTHFFFSTEKAIKRKKKKKSIFVMSIIRTWPYRIIEKKYARTAIGRYFEGRPELFSSKDDFRLKNRTWKIWGTKFIEVLDEGKALFDYKEKRDENLFEYFICAEDKWIEIHTIDPEWEEHRDTTVNAVLRKYLRLKSVF